MRPDDEVTVFSDHTRRSALRPRDRCRRPSFVLGKDVVTCLDTRGRLSVYISDVSYFVFLVLLSILYTVPLVYGSVVRFEKMYVQEYEDVDGILRSNRSQYSLL